MEDERTAQMFKFTKMKKKEPFLPSLKLRGYFENAQALVPIHGPNMDYRDREALIFPDRIKERSRKWKLQPSASRFFTKPAGREVDVFDASKLRYYLNENKRTTLSFA